MVSPSTKGHVGNIVDVESSKEGVKYSVKTEGEESEKFHTWK